MYNQTKTPLTIEGAKLLVNTSIRSKLGCNSGDYVRHDYLESHNCWMFYLMQSPEVIGHKDLHGRGYIVSKSGDILSVADFSFDSDIANDFLEFTSVFYETGVRDKHVWDDIIKRSKEKNWGN